LRRRIWIPRTLIAWQSAMSVDWIGWISSFLLVGTMARQIYKQWEENTGKGVSLWLYLGQFLAEIGFVAYSWLVKNWVFVFTNATLLLMNIFGLILLLQQKKKKLA
jgi:MtN3 and saliva related transmembrane protein